MEQEKLEIWRNVPGYENYQASSLGDVRSVDRWITYSDGRERFYKGRVIDGYINKNTGYRQFRLYVNGEGITLRASQIIAMAFLNHTPDGFDKVIDHVNGDKSDDRLSNLRIVSQRENASTCFRKDRDSLSSRFTGVDFYKKSNKWRSRVRVNKKYKHLGLYPTELEAYQAYKKALSEINNGTFNPLDYKPVYTSRYKGISFNKKSNKWMSQIWVNGKSKYLGLYPTELEAHEAIQKFKQEVKKH